ncbi:Putative MCE family protein [Mycobacteroides abscessus]|nr:Putative MCE family protein [Mycobacteroides abscessus]
MAEQSRWQRIKSRPVETYNKTWLGFIAIAVIGALVGGMLLVKAIGFGYTTYTAKFAQAASLRAGQPITVAGIPMGTVGSMKLVGDHVEAKLSVSDDVKLGKDTKAAIRVTTILGSRYLDLSPEGPGSLPNKTIDLAHTEVPYDLQATLKDATNTFDQVDFDKVAQSLSILGKQLDGLPEVVPQAMQNIQTLSQIIAERRDQLGTLLKSTEKVTNTLHRQQQGIGTLINQGQNLIGEFVVRRGTFHAMMQSLTNLVQQLSKSSSGTGHSLTRYSRRCISSPTCSVSTTTCCATSCRSHRSRCAASPTPPAPATPSSSTRPTDWPSTPGCAQSAVVPNNSA